MCTKHFYKRNESNKKFFQSVNSSLNRVVDLQIGINPQGVQISQGHNSFVKVKSVEKRT